MSIKLEIFANDAEEYFSILSKLLAGAAPGALRGSTAEEANNSGKGTTTRTRPAKPDTAEAGASAATAGASTETGTTSTTAAAAASRSEQAKTETKVEPAAAEAPTEGLLDFDKHVAPKVLGYVKSHSKDFVSSVLSEFGVAKASELPAERWPELLEALDNAASVA